MRSVELFAGAGGLALATSQAGFDHVALLENDAAACETLNENRRRGCEWAKAWPAVQQVDISKFNYSSISGPVDLLSGGPPCQPFSLAGKKNGVDDERDLFAEVARAMRCLRPRAILIENTKGLALKLFQKQLRHICLQLTYPERRRRHGEQWEAFSARLERVAKAGKASSELRYDVTAAVLNAANYGTAQQRERLIFVGFREPDAAPFAFPDATHSLDALLYQQWVTEAYWDRHQLPRSFRPRPPEKYKSRIKRLSAGPAPNGSLPWVTVRDAFSTLPQPFAVGADSVPPNHYARAGARAYRKHTGSVYDLPSKVIKAGRHGVPGGENMLAYPFGEVRYFTTRECARLQSFPDDYFFTGGWKSLTRQVGNAVPVLMCRRVAEAVRERLAAAGGVQNVTRAVA